MTDRPQYWPILLLLVAVASLWQVSIAATHASISGIAGHVHDGDSFELVRSDGSRVQIRIAGIDAPERSQPYSDTARDNLRRLLSDRPVEAHEIKRDPFGRSVANVFTIEAVGPTEAASRPSKAATAPLDIGLAQLQAGLAWHFLRYQSEQSPEQRRLYSIAEADSRRSRRGLWLDPSPLAPWKYRAQARRDGRRS